MKVLFSPLLLLLLAGQAAAQPSRKDSFGDPLPEGVIARAGSGRMRLPPLTFRMAVAGDGKIVVTQSYNRDRDGIFHAWDTANGKTLWRTVIPSKPADEFVRDMGIAQSKVLVVLGHLFKKQTGIVRRLDLKSGKELTRKEFSLGDAEPSEVALSPDARMAALAANEEVRLYDLDSGRETLRIPASVGKLRWSPDAKSIVIIASGAIHIHDAKTGARLREFKQAAGRDFDLSADGRLLVSLSWADKGDGPLIVWDVASGRERYRLMNYRWGTARFSPDGKHLAVSGWAKDLTLLDRETGKVVREFGMPWTDQIGFSADGKMLAAYATSIALWDVATGRRLPGSADPIMEVSHLRFADGGKRLIGIAETVMSWDTATGKELRRTPVPPHQFPISLSLSPDESLVAGQKSDKRIFLADSRSGKEIRTFDSDDWAVTLFSADSQRLVTSGGGPLRVWNVRTGKMERRLPGTENESPQAFSADGKWLLTHDDATNPKRPIRLWNIDHGQEGQALLGSRALRGYRPATAFSADSQWLAIVLPASDGQQIEILHTVSGKESRSWTVPKGRLGCIAFSPDDRMLASGGENLSLWEVFTGKKRQQFEGHQSRVWSVAFSPDGNLLAAASNDAPVYIWDVWAGMPAPKKLLLEDLERCWADLAAEDAAAGFRAIRLLSTAPEQSVPWLRERLKPVQLPDVERVRRLIADLDSKKFNERQKAAVELEQLGDAAGHLIEQAVPRASSVETRRRLENLLARLHVVTPAATRVVRAVEALEWAGTREGLRLLDDLAQGAPAALLTREAAKARDRLRQLRAVK